MGQITKLERDIATAMRRGDDAALTLTVQLMAVTNARDDTDDLSQISQSDVLLRAVIVTACPLRGNGTMRNMALKFPSHEQAPAGCAFGTVQRLWYAVRDNDLRMCGWAAHRIAYFAPETSRPALAHALKTLLSDDPNRGDAVFGLLNGLTV